MAGHQPMRLTAPAVHTPFGGFEEQVFTGHGRIKKAAEHAAAEQDWMILFLWGRKARRHLLHKRSSMPP
ncbi:hypothetical protein CVIRNUC_000298 [Coccomyxa viridis]|uniref:Uncharacterized protein n=1 Tax=Coccomyxa viridis TaxID=1274662 RepID=A0AAV1HQ31_9CHLO|nr:hypothetical protein CVIRNUC_000298 [Coccomyxa viridis]